MSKCPVCEAECTSVDKECPVCGFPNPIVEFVSQADAEEWRRKTLEPCRAIWRKAQVKMHCSDQFNGLKGDPLFGITEGDSSEFILKELPDGTVEIEKFVGFEMPEITVPNVIDGKKVTGIGIGAYQKCTHICSITISEGIKYIRGEAFLDCSQLVKVNFPSSLERIGETEPRIWYGAFTRCTLLENIECPSNLQMIGNRTFSECSSLRKTVLNEGLSFIGEGAFESCTALSEIYIPNSVQKIGKGCFDIWERNGSTHKRFKSDITLHCRPGAYALVYARENNMNCVRAD